jgi:asparagine synthase (glutamine-hydrolysing)
VVYSIGGPRGRGLAVNGFLCLLPVLGRPLTESARSRYSAIGRRIGLTPEWSETDGLTVMRSIDPVVGFGPELVRWGEYVGVGIARLDDRAEIARRTGCRDDGCSDLELAVRVVADHGARHAIALVGDFALVVWHRATRHLVAARDPMGVKPLFYAYRPGFIGIASRSQLLAADTDNAYDEQYFAELIGYCVPSADRSPFVGVHPLPPAAVTRLTSSGTVSTSYWSPAAFEPASYRQSAERDLIDEFRDLHATAVTCRLTRDRSAWSQLSGGLDSSSVVSMAQWLARAGRVPEGLAGTVTWVDRHGTGNDERAYVQTVVQKYGIRNEQIIDYSDSQDDEDGPPLVDEPSGRYPFYTLDRRTAGIVRRAGGRVLCTGMGGDDLLMGNMFFFADWIASGRPIHAIREMARRSAIGRVSFWELAYRNAVVPLLPRGLRRALLPPSSKAPAWICSSMDRRYHIAERQTGLDAYSGRLRHKYADYANALVQALQGRVHDGLIHDLLDTRHPFIDRRLIEFCLRLPPELCVRPYARKWILREATRGILPERIRTRVGKGAATALTGWWIDREHDRIERLLRDPILAQHGWIDAPKLRAALATRGANEKVYLDAYHTIGIEMWLQVRSGRWAAGTITMGSRHSHEQDSSTLHSPLTHHSQVLLSSGG